MIKIKKPLITRIVGNRHACSLLIAIIFLFTGTGYSASEPSTLRPALLFSKTGKGLIKENPEPADSGARLPQGQPATPGGARLPPSIKEFPKQASSAATTPAQQIFQIPEGLSVLETTLEGDKIIVSLTPQQQDELKTKLDSYLSSTDERQRYLAKICLEEIRLIAILRNILGSDSVSSEEVPHQWCVHDMNTEPISLILDYGYYAPLERQAFWPIVYPVVYPLDVQPYGPQEAGFSFSIPKALKWLVGIPEDSRWPAHYGLSVNTRVDNLPPVLREKAESAGTFGLGFLLLAEGAGQLGHIPSLFIDIEAMRLENQKLPPDYYQKLMTGLGIIRERQELFKQHLGREDLFKSRVQLIASSAVETMPQKTTMVPPPAAISLTEAPSETVSLSISGSSTPRSCL